MARISRRLDGDRRGSIHALQPTFFRCCVDHPFLLPYCPRPPPLALLPGSKNSKVNGGRPILITRAMPVSAEQKLKSRIDSALLVWLWVQGRAGMFGKYCALFFFFLSSQGFAFHYQLPRSVSSHSQAVAPFNLGEFVRLLANSSHFWPWARGSLGSRLQLLSYCPALTGRLGVFRSAWR